MFVKTIEILHKKTYDAYRLPLPYIEFGFQKFNLYFISDHIPPLLKIRHLWQLKIAILKHWCLIGSGDIHLGINYSVLNETKRYK